MRKAIQLTIPEPCHARWNQMTKTEQGRFCSSCQKQVIDFTHMSDREVLAYFATSTGATCGRFQPGQLDRPLAFPKKQFAWARYIFRISLPLFLANLKAGAQKKPAAPLQEDIRMCSMVLGKVAQTPAVKENDMLTIAGTVKDEEGFPVTYASVMVRNSRRGTVTDSAGNYSLDVNTKKDTLIISAVGYSSKEIQPVPEKQNEVILTSQEVQLMGMVGEVLIIDKPKPVSLFKTIFRDSVFSAFHVYPNPVMPNADMQLYWKGKGGEFFLSIRDISGREWLRQPMYFDKKSVRTLHLPSLSQGSYLAVLTDKKTGKSFTEKFIVQ